jgi:peptidoglycan/LPS O-acetylase OafA/YrhL
MRRLADVVSGRDNSLNLIRVVAAAGVLLSHAYRSRSGRGRWSR